MIVAIVLLATVAIMGVLTIRYLWKARQEVNNLLDRLNQLSAMSTNVRGNYDQP
jgi:hypothetical protein